MKLNLFKENVFAYYDVNKIESIITFLRDQSILYAHNIELLIKFQVLFRL